MFMILLKKNAPILVFLLVAALCGVWAWSSYDDPKSDPEVVKGEAAKKTIANAMSAGQPNHNGLVAADYPWSAEKAAGLKYVDNLKKNVERIKNAVDGQIGTFVSYPQPTRPKSAAKPEPIPGIDVQSVAPSLKDGNGDTVVKADRGAMYVKVEIPKYPDDFNFTDPEKRLPAPVALLQPVRVEIFRGLSKDKIDLTKPIGTIELELEAPPELKPGQVVPPPPVEAPKTSVRGGSGDRVPRKKNSNCRRRRASSKTRRILPSRRSISIRRVWSCASRRKKCSRF